MLTFKKNRATANHVLSPQVFLSYARKDQVLTKAILGELKEKEFKIWIDVQEILPTAEWWQVILEAIDQSAVFLVIVSPHSMSSVTCMEELKYALATGKKIVPLLVGDLQPAGISPALQKLNWVNWDYTKTFTENIDGLTFAINIDLAWHSLRTSLLSQTTFWIKNNETRDVLLKGNMLLNAESWLDDSYTDKNKLITSDQRRFILQSRKAVARAYLLPMVNGVILVAIFSQLLTAAGQTLITPGTLYGLMNLELARGPAEVEHILQTWSSVTDGIDTARTVIFLDFAFIYAYTLLFFFALKYFIVYFHRRKKLFSRVGLVLLTLTFFCAALDISENMLLLKILGGDYFNLALLLKTIAVAKFLLFTICVFYIIASFILTRLLRKQVEAIEVYQS